MTDEELVAFAQEFREGILEGRSAARMCFIVCFPLEGLLNASGVECRLIRGSVAAYDHVWLELEDGRILDPTADQFASIGNIKMPEVYLGPRLAWYDPVPIEA